MFCIGIDGRVLGPQPKGISRYVWELCKALDKVLPEARFIVYSRRPISPMPVISARWRWRCDISRTGAKIPNSLWCILRLGYLAKRDNLDVFWGGTGILPLAGLRCRTVLTVHDLVYRLAPKTASFRALWAMRLFFASSVRRADVIVSNSAGTANRFEAFYEKKIGAIVPPGLTETIRRRHSAEVQAVLLRYGIAQPYLLSVGTLEPRKGLHRLVPAFDSLLREGRLPNHCLVIAGDRGWKDDQIARLVSSNRRIHPLGFVTDDTLSALYTGAEALVFPSSYEGFGMPVLEARACGTRIVTTDIPELREAGGEDAVYISPSIEGIREGILKALESEKPKVLNRQDHTWAKSAKTFAAILTDNTMERLARSA